MYRLFGALGKHHDVIDVPVDRQQGRHSPHDPGEIERSHLISFFRPSAVKGPPAAPDPETNG